MRAHVLLTVALLASAGLAGCASSPGPGTSVTVETSFEDGLTGWTENSHVPDDPNRPGKQVAWNITFSTDEARTGERSVKYDLDGRQDDGTIWITQPIGIEQDQAYHAEVTAWAWSENESFNTRAYLVMHLGFSAPQVEEDFPPPGENSTGDENATSGGLREVLDKAPGWTKYRFEWTIPASQAREVFMSVGISAVWETEMVFYVDDLTVELTRLASDGTTASQDDGSGPY